jgi:hypothetical protein
MSTGVTATERCLRTSTCRFPGTSIERACLVRIKSV